jgi:hypothetical protein
MVIFSLSKNTTRRFKLNLDYINIKQRTNFDNPVLVIVSQLFMSREISSKMAKMAKYDQKCQKLRQNYDKKWHKQMAKCCQNGKNWSKMTKKVLLQKYV